ncbi:MAG TPA: alpha/beta hydrolase [Gemmatimonadales bacterium]|nr:alpha/beta hydrolase [Gemmatimonadales bacterium]
MSQVSRSIEVAGETFPVVDVGHGPAVLLLHGFPDSRLLWRHQVPALVDAGYRVIAPDLRGFGDAPRPTDIRAYRRPALVSDALGLLDALDLDRVHLVGHDWGASLAWRIAGSCPDRINRLVVMSVGAPMTPGWETAEQKKASWYFEFFCQPGIAEAAIVADDWKILRDWCRGQGDQERYLRELARPGALTAGLNWYRGAFLPPGPDEKPWPPLPRWEKVRCPTLGIWGENDPFLLEPQIEGSGPFVDAPWRYERITEAGHWLMLDQPEMLNRLLLEFLRVAP